MRTICFTGRRPKDLCGYKKENYTAFTAQLVDYLQTFYDLGVRKWISGGAQGFDQISFWAVDTLRQQHPDVENVVYVPYEGQQLVWRGNQNDAFSQKEYGEMLKRATHVNILVTAAQFIKEKCVYYLMQRNNKMVDDSDAVVALYPDDSWVTSKGGTAACMRYAKKAGKPIYQIHYHIENSQLIFDYVSLIQ